jgi:hypothetical protein
VWSVESKATFRKKISLSSSGTKNKPARNQCEAGNKKRDETPSFFFFSLGTESELPVKKLQEPAIGIQFLLVMVSNLTTFARFKQFWYAAQ